MKDFLRLIGALVIGVVVWYLTSAYGVPVGLGAIAFLLVMLETRLEHLGRILDLNFGQMRHLQRREDQN